MGCIEKEIELQFDEELLALNPNSGSYEQVETVLIIYSYNADEYHMDAFYPFNKDSEDLLLVNKEDADKVEDFARKEVEYVMSGVDMEGEYLEALEWERIEAAIDEARLGDY